MNIKKYAVYLASFSAVLILGGCAGNIANKNDGIQIDPKLHSVSKDDYTKTFGAKEIELPQNYSTKNYKRLTVSAWFFPNKDSGNFGDQPVETLSTMMETEISKLKRFTIVSRHLGQKGKLAEKNFQDMGTTDRKTKMRFGKGINADYSLTGGISAVKEEYGRGGKTEILYIIRVDYQLIDNETDEIIEADMAEGRAIRNIIKLPSGKVIGGFDQEEEKDALAQAAIKALRVVSNKIGNKLPIGGQVVGIKGQRFAIDKGYEDGFMGKQTVVLYTSDMGIDLPIAVGEINPGKYKTSGKIIAWTKDEDIQDIVQDVQSNKNYSKENEVYAVSTGMPLPPEWEENYKD